MPIYEFRCKDCEKVFETFYKLRDFKKATMCNCGGVAFLVVSKVRKHINMSGETGDIDGVTRHFRNRKDLRGHIAKYNDSERADKTGKLAVMED